MLTFSQKKVEELSGIRQKKANSVYSFNYFRLLTSNRRVCSLTPFPSSKLYAKPECAVNLVSFGLLLRFHTLSSLSTNQVIEPDWLKKNLSN